MAGKYHYNDLIDLSPAELFTWITIDTTLKQLGISDVVGVFAIVIGLPILPIRQKFKGATAGTSIASVTLRHYLNFELKHKVPTLTWGSIKRLRFSYTRNLGAVAGRAIPVLGIAILAHDVFVIMRESIALYNRIVRPEDRIF